MFIMKRKTFNDYASWLFQIIGMLENRITVSEDAYQKRVFGFLSERLMPVFVEINKLRVKTVPIVYLEENLTKNTWKRRSIRTMLADSHIIHW